MTRAAAQPFCIQLPSSASQTIAARPGGVAQLVQGRLGFSPALRELTESPSILLLRQLLPDPAAAVACRVSSPPGSRRQPRSECSICTTHWEQSQVDASIRSAFWLVHVTALLAFRANTASLRLPHVAVPLPRNHATTLKQHG